MSETWRTRQLGDLVQLNTESINPPSQPNREFVHHSLPAYDDVGGPTRQLGRSIQSNKTLVRAPAVLVSKLNPRIPRVSIVPNIPTNEIHCASTEFMVYEPSSDQVDLKFLRYSFLSANMRNRLTAVATGTTGSHTRANPRQTLRWDLDLPPIREQRKIAEILDMVDESIRSTERLIAKQRSTHLALIEDHLRNPERRSTRWRTIQLADACSHVVDCPHSTPKFVSNGALVARTTNIRGGQFIKDAASYVSWPDYVARNARATPASGDVILTREAPVGEAFEIPERMQICLGQRVMLLRPARDIILPSFLVTHVYGEQIRRQIRMLTAGTTNPHLNVVEVRRLVVDMPSIDEQKKIMSRIHGSSNKLLSTQAELAKLRAIKLGLREDLLTGRVRVKVD